MGNWEWGIGKSGAGKKYSERKFYSNPLVRSDILETGFFEKTRFLVRDSILIHLGLLSDFYLSLPPECFAPTVLS